MSNWQPARLRIAHEMPDLPGLVHIPDEELNELLSKVRLVRVHKVTDKLVEMYRVRRCDSTKFYQVKDTDQLCCEHEILTD